MPRSRRLLVSLTLALSALAGLPGRALPASRQRLKVDYSGCLQVLLPGPACVLNNDRTLTLWVDLPPEIEIEIQAGGQTIRRAGFPVQGGQRFKLKKIPLRASAIALRASTPGGEARWSMPLASRRIDEGIKIQKTANTLRKDGRGKEAKELFVRAAAAHRAAGSLLAEVQAETTLVWMEIQDGQLAAARQAIDQLHLPKGSPAEAFYYADYQAGLLAQHTGDTRSALADLTSAGELASRAGLVRESLQAGELLGLQLQAVGRSSEAFHLFERLRRTAGLSPCDRAELLINQGWSWLLAGETEETGRRLRDPIPLLEEASKIEERERTSCVAYNERLLGNLLNLALAHLQAGELGGVRELLSRTEQMDRYATLTDRLWRLDLEARLDLAEGHPDRALTKYQRLGDLAAASLAPESLWRAAYGRALCERGLGRKRAALEALREADGLLEDESLQVPIHEGREGFLAQREKATGLHLQLLLATRRAGEALDLARRSRSRLLRQLARGDRLAQLTPAEQATWDTALGEFRQRRMAADEATTADWALPKDQLWRVLDERARRYAVAERSLDRAFAVLGSAGRRDGALPPPQPGEVTLAYHPIAGRWVGFAQIGQLVAVHPFDLSPDVLASPGKLAAQLLVPFQAEIERARRVRILPYGALRGVDFQALPFAGDVLLAAHPVVYGLDLTTPRDASPPAKPRALVVANPLLDLPQAAHEGEVVAAALRSGWSVTLLQGPSATVEAVKAALADSDLFHFAGHGFFAGTGGWESDLRLAGGSRLTVADLLALRRVPRWVVLSGCETGRSSEAPIEGLGLAQAFVLAGSRAVIATTRTVEDRDAEAMVKDLYTHETGTPPDLAALLRQAQLAWRKRDPNAHWASFRVFEP
jgi:cellulose synthase operon protein C